MTENFNSMYWIGKRVEHRELAEALRAAARREARNKRAKERRAVKREASLRGQSET